MSCARLRQAVTDVLDAEIGDDAVALRQMLWDALNEAGPLDGCAASDDAATIRKALAMASEAPYWDDEIAEFEGLREDALAAVGRLVAERDELRARLAATEQERDELLRHGGDWSAKPAEAAIRDQLARVALLAEALRAAEEWTREHEATWHRLSPTVQRLYMREYRVARRALAGVEQARQPGEDLGDASGVVWRSA